MLEARYQQLSQEVREAAEVAGRKCEEVKLVAVSKTHPYEKVQELYQLGHRLFAENRVQETQAKYPQVRPEGLELHLIGHLQSNKVKKALLLFDAIDSVDSLELAQKLDTYAERPLPILLELKTAPEETKSGFESEEQLFRALDLIMGCRNLVVKGLMTIGPLGSSEKEVRSAFSRLREALFQVQRRYGIPGCDQLSMGMSGDWKWAIEEGSTMVRIGTSLFGERHYET